MKKQEMQDGILQIFYDVKEAVQNDKGMTKEEVRKLYDKVFYLAQQSSLK